MNAGELNRRVTIEGIPTKTADGIGGYTATAGTSKVVWAAVKQISQYESLQYGLEADVSGYEFTFRYYTASALTKECTLVYMGRNFRIVKINDPMEAKDFIKVIAYERGA